METYPGSSFGLGESSFQKNLIVWKLRICSQSIGLRLNVSEELNSVETRAGCVQTGHSETFQKNLIVWKRYSIITKEEYEMCFRRT